MPRDFTEPRCQEALSGDEREKPYTWLHTSGCQTLYIEPGHPWENPFIERFIGTLKRECLDRYLFDSLSEAQYLIEQWCEEYNRHRPHSSLDYLTPVEYARQHRANVIPLTQPGT